MPAFSLVTSQNVPKCAYARVDVPNRFRQTGVVLTMTQNWKALGTAVRERREALGLAVADCTSGRSISDTTWGKLESGRPILRTKVVHVPAAIRWEPESIDLVLGGGTPIEIAEEAAAVNTEGTVAIIEELSALTAELVRRARDGQL